MTSRRAEIVSFEKVKAVPKLVYMIFGLASRKAVTAGIGVDMRVCAVGYTYFTFGGRAMGGVRPSQPYVMTNGGVFAVLARISAAISGCEWASTKFSI